MNKQLFLTFIAIICLSLVINGCDFSSSSQPFDTTNNSSASTTSFEKTSSSAQSKTSKFKFPFSLGSDDPYSDHCFTDFKNKADCKTLTGEVLLTIFLVDDSKSTWTASDVKNFKKAQQNATVELEQEAKKHNTDLKITINYIKCKADVTLNDDIENIKKWYKNVLETAGFKDAKDLLKKLQEKHNAKEFPVIFAVNRLGRSSSWPRNTYKGFEYALLFSDCVDYKHELLHLFGAEDFYFPKKVKKTAEKYFPDSVMLESENKKTDELTAYLIGWMDTPTDTAKKFLDETAWITDSIIKQAREEENFTGNGSLELDDATYTGDLLSGEMHGKGKLVFKNGDVYEGDFVSGYMDGKGTYVWPNGDKYVGDFHLNVRQGKGKYFWSSGDKYTGDFVENQMHGKGRYILANGDVYEGDFKNEVAEGYGVYTWASDGSVYEGEFKNWKFHGQGTCTWADGTVQSGLWGNDKFIG